MGTVVQPEVTEHSAGKFAKFNDEYIDLRPVFLGQDRTYTTAALTVVDIHQLLDLTAIRELIDTGVLSDKDVPINLTIKAIHYVESGVLKKQDIKPADIVLTPNQGPMGSDTYTVTTLVGKIDVMFNMYTGGLEAIPRRAGRMVGISVELERGPYEEPMVDSAVLNPAS